MLVIRNANDRWTLVETLTILAFHGNPFGKSPISQLTSNPPYGDY